MMRLDKYLAERTGMTRSESRKAVTKGRVSIDGAVCRVVINRTYHADHVLWQCLANPENWYPGHTAARWWWSL